MKIIKIVEKKGRYNVIVKGNDCVEMIKEIKSVIGDFYYNIPAWNTLDICLYNIDTNINLNKLNKLKELY